MRRAFRARVFEQVRELRELGVGINTLPHAIKELAALGLLPALDRAGIRTRELIYANRFGQEVWRELRGTDAGFETPQFSIHRGKLHGVLLDAVRERLGADAVRDRLPPGRRSRRMRTACVARFERRDSGETLRGRRAMRWSAPTASTRSCARRSTRTRGRRCGTASCCGAARPTGRSMATAAPW